MSGLKRPIAVLFDLDGTLIDSAPDLIATLNRLRVDRGLTPLAAASVRHLASTGARGLVQGGFPGADQRLTAQLVERFLTDYRENLWQDSRPFAGIEQLLSELEQRGMKWGVVTNKVSGLARPTLQAAGWLERAGCLVAGDSTPEPKPSPQPVREACRLLGCRPDQAWFVGDDERDVMAGRSAGTATIVASWGYLPPDQSGRDWGADCVIDQPLQVLELMASSSGVIHG